ncbi:MAG: ISAzo13 family transposase [Candidatus Anammoxibacter sp.]
MEYEKAGDPTGKGLKWIRKTPAKIAEQLALCGIEVSGKAVGTLIKGLNYSLRCNSKKISNGGRKLTKEEREERNEQFEYINKKREEFVKHRYPVISVDTKAKEMIGNFKNAGTRYKKESDLVFDHDFRNYGIGRAISGGIFDVQRYEGFVYVSQSLWDKDEKKFTSSEPSEFVVDNITQWWKCYGRKTYPKSDKILILVDSGGANGYRSRMWKLKLNELLCDKYGIEATVCHYPAGASKWNPIEHRLFSEISKNWQGTPLESYETVLKYIRSTKTKTGLKVRSHLITKHYLKGRKVSDEDFKAIEIRPHNTIPKWNYTLIPNDGYILTN